MSSRKPGFGRVLFAIIGCVAFIAVAANFAQDPARKGLAETPAETFNLVHAIGNDESVIATGLSKTACETRKEEQTAVSDTLGATNTKAGVGSITCLPADLSR